MKESIWRQSGCSLFDRNEYYGQGGYTAPDIYISLGKYLIVVEVIISVILLLLRISVEYSIVIGACIGGAFLLYGFYHTDKKICEKFADK